MGRNSLKKAFDLILIEISIHVPREGHDIASQITL